mmetsp:Transcript_23372/g.61554  ORF Transcript_23372/g.61554 Transcript_23372/m.61554 type:complete len:298 (+) Transcript_23372:247-1140(+)
MACQGCGRVSEKRLCCPTCIEFGRTSFFCGQECFTTNWNAHNQLHELMRRKQGVVEGGTPAGLDAGPLEVVPPSAVASSGAAGLGGGGGGGGASGSRGFAPLAGGTSIVNLSGQKRSSTSAPLVPAAAAGGSAAGGGIFGSLVGHARAVLGDSGAAATSALKSRLGGGGGSGAGRSHRAVGVARGSQPAGGAAAALAAEALGPRRLARRLARLLARLLAAARAAAEPIASVAGVGLAEPAAVRAGRRGSEPQSDADLGGSRAGVDGCVCGAGLHPLRVRGAQPVPTRVPRRGAVLQR